MDPHLFRIEGSTAIPSQWTRGPWDPEFQHGGPISALAAHLAESAPGPEPSQVVRLTVELLRPLPLAPMDFGIDWVKRGRNVALADVRFSTPGRLLARATVLRIRTTDLPVPDTAVDRGVPDHHRGTPVQRPGGWGFDSELVTYHRQGVEHRMVTGGFHEPGDAVDWVRLRVPLVEGRENSPLVKLVAAADFGNGISWRLHPDEGWRFLNPDLTVYVHRLPKGDWVRLQATTSAHGHGIGMAESLLSDEEGPLGRALQSLLIDRDQPTGGHAGRRPPTGGTGSPQ